IRDRNVTGVQTCALPISAAAAGIRQLAPFVDAKLHDKDHASEAAASAGCRVGLNAYAFHDAAATALTAVPAGDERRLDGTGDRRDRKSVVKGKSGESGCR